VKNLSFVASFVPANPKSQIPNPKSQSPNPEVGFPPKNLGSQLPWVWVLGFGFWVLGFASLLSFLKGGRAARPAPPERRPPFACRHHPIASNFAAPARQAARRLSRQNFSPPPALLPPLYYRPSPAPRPAPTVPPRWPPSRPSPHREAVKRLGKVRAPRVPRGGSSD
jgi:hypothetical protein